MTTVEMTAAPERSVEQRMDALRLANETRVKRAELKRDLKAGRANVIALLQDPPEHLLTMKVADLLLAIPKVGEVKVKAAMWACRCSSAKTIGGLSDRQRRELITELTRPRPYSQAPLVEGLS